MEGKKYEKIMVATDGSKAVKKAIETGIELAKLSGAKLYAVYVIVPAGYYSRDFGGGGLGLNFYRLKGIKPLLLLKMPGGLPALR